MKRFFALLLVCTMLLSLLPVMTAFAANIASGTCGEVFWTFSDDGTLTFSGSGATADYDSTSAAQVPWKQYAGQVKKVVYESGVTYIGSYTFFNGKNMYPELTELEIKGAETIGTRAFRYSALTKASLGDQLKVIGPGAFSYCSSLRSIVFPDSLEEIGYEAFVSCEALTEVSFPDRLQMIGYSAFIGCTALTDAVIPSDSTLLGSQAFKGCNALTVQGITNSSAYMYCMMNGFPFVSLGTTTVVSVYASGTDGEIDWTFYSDGTLIISGEGAMTDYTSSNYRSAPWFDYAKQTTKIIIESGVTHVGDYSFYNTSNTFYKKLTDVEINCTGDVGDSAFKYCSQITNLTLGENVEAIGERAFSYCTALTEVSLPDNVTQIGAYAFSYCDALTSVVLPDGLQTISTGLFYACGTLESVTVPSSVTKVDSNPFKYTNVVINCCDDSWFDMYGLLNKLTMNYLDKLEEPAIYDTGTTGDVTWTFYADGTLVIEGEGAMADYTGKDAPWYPYCSQILSVQIGDGVTEVGALAFAGCSKITEVYFEGDAPEIASNAFTNVTANAYYHYVKDGWTEDVLLNYGGKLTWESMECIHVYETAVTEPTCLDGGYTTYTCTKCGDTYTADETEPLGHDYVGTVTEPTCLDGGYTTYVCSRCEDFYVADETEALGHKEVTDEAVTPTCTQTGLTEGSHCAVCGEIFAPQEIVPAADHDYIADTTAPTCTADGSATYTCANCGDTYTEVLPAAECPTKDYKDVPNTSNWGHAGIDFCVDRGIMGSMSKNELTFEPGTTCTRAMIVSILYRLSGSPQVEYEAVFPDVPDGQWYSKAVIWGYQNGVVKGFDTGKFEPNGKITREQMAVILKGYTENVVGKDTSASVSLDQFYDANKVTWSKPCVEWAVAVGMIYGKTQSDGKTMLDPKGNATRAEVASILMRYIQNILE